MAAHGTARDRSGAPGSALHFKRTERSQVSLIAFAALVYSGLVARLPKSCTCIDRTRRVSPNYHHSPRMSPWLHSCGSPRLICCCTRRLLFGWAGKISSVVSRFELFSPYHARLGECNLEFLADSRCISEQYII